MVAGALAFVLHGHLPYVRSRHPGSLEEDWFFQALTESYLPLIEMLQRSLQQGAQPRLTMSLSPTLLSLLVDPVLQERYEPWLQQRIELLERSSSEEQAAAADLSQHLQRQRQAFRRCGGNVLKHFVQLQRQGVLDLLTCCATHGYLPLLRDPSAAVQGQLRTAVREHERLIGEAPRGIWLPECAYFEGLDQQLAKAGLRYAILDAHGLLHALPRPRYGVYAPICSPGAVAFFGRDSEATLPVWSASDGYPGDPSYREFHRDIGWDLEESELQAAGIPSSRPLGLKLRRVSGGDCPLEAKLPYDPAAAERTAAGHAQSYVQARIQQLSELGSVMDQAPMVVAPFDAELFGHWWFEGPRFLEQVFAQGQAQGLSFTTLRQTLSQQPQLQVCRPSPSSWGQGGYHSYWLSSSNAWVVPDWHRACLAMVEVTAAHQGKRNTKHQRLLKQAARELLLAQSSDWSFILRAGTTTELARERIHRHLGRFWRLLDALQQPNHDTAEFERWLGALEREDSLFPSIDPSDWLP